MSPDFAIEFMRRAVVTTLTVAAPLLVASLLVGVTVSLVQSVTQIQEQTLTFIPKILALGAVLLFILPWIVSQMVEFMTGAFSAVSTVLF